MALAAVAADLNAEGRPSGRLRTAFLAVAGLALALGATVAFTPAGAPVERGVHDLQARLHATRTVPAGVLVLDIDEPTLAALEPLFGAWPWKRDVYALAVDRLRGLGARAVALDLLMTDARAGDEALARTLARPGTPVVLAAAGTRHASDLGSLGAVRPAVSPGEASPAGPHDRTTPAVPAFEWPHIVGPARSLLPPSAPVAVGVITGPIDDDGRLRHLPAWHRSAMAPQARWPAMPLAVLGASHGEAALRDPPLDRQGRLLLPGATPRARVATLPLATLFQGLGDADPGADPAGLSRQVTGSTVFIGSSALLADTVMTLQGQMTGTQALAHAYAALRDGRMLRQAPDAWRYGGLLLALAPVAWALRRGRTSLRFDLIAGATTLAAGLAAAALAWRDGPWVVPLAGPLCTWLTAAFGLAALHAHEARKAQRRLRRELALAEAAAQAKTQFLTTVSHEMRTPLNALLGVAELLESSALSVEQRRQVGLFRDAGHSLLTLINDLLDLSKIEAGKLVLQPTRVALPETLSQLVALLAPRAQAKGLALTLELDDSVPADAWIDRQRLLQALTNLVGNALKFTPAGRVVLQARCDDTPPSTWRSPGRRSRGPAPSRWLHLAVNDTGIGIPAERLEAVFEPFAQADDSISRDYGGTGLGLSLTRQVARQMGGEIDVTSHPGVGSTFTLHLPFMPPPALPDRSPAGPEASGAAPAATEAVTPRQVLLAEDNDVNTYLFCAMLDSPDLQIETAPDGLAAWDRLMLRRYDIAFIDIQMPGLDGLSLTRRLRALEADSGRQRTPVVALTANAFASDVQASLDAGCDHHLPKPFTREMLRAAIDRWAEDPDPASAVSGQPG